MSRFVSVAGEAVADLAALCAEPGRLSRGRTLFRKGSVIDLAILEGSIIASVRGSEGDVYETTIGTALAPPGVQRQVAQGYNPENADSIDNLISDGVDVCPREVDLAFACDCGDWEEPCKHVVAALFAVADRVDLDETELLRWRSIDISTASPTEAETPTTPPARPTTRSRPPVTPRLKPEPKGQPATVSETGTDEPIDRTAKLSELEALLGNTVMRVPSTDSSDDEQAAAPLARAMEPAMADFLGIGTTISPVDTTGIAAAAPLFADMQLGPLADLGPALAEALSTIVTKLESVQPD